MRWPVYLVDHSDLTPVGRVDDDAHQAARHEAGDGHSNEPTAVDPGNHAPVDGAPVTVAETHTDGTARDALGSGNGETLGRISETVRLCKTPDANIPKRVAMIIVMADPSSMEKPREGEIRVILLPMLVMILYP